MIRPAPPLLRWWLKLTGFRGIALPPLGVYILEESLWDDRLVRHEMAHWAQYQRMGLVKFYALYIWYSIRFGYRENPMEKEARDAETKV